MQDDFSFGVIPFHKESKRFLIIRHRKDHWSFPKGHAEGKEKPEQAALRELYEETHITPAKLDSRVFTERYSFIKNNITITKKVTYFIGFVQNAEVSIQEEELRDFAWLTYEQALATITFENAQYVLKEAHAYLTTLKLV